MVSSSDLNKFCFAFKIPSLFLGIFSFVLIYFSVINWDRLQGESRDFIAPPPEIEHFVFGFGEVTADMLWIRSVQDFDYCDSNSSSCKQNSWLFHMLDTVTNLSPHFRIPYAAGGLALTVLASDIEGATKIFDKGVAAFPHDWPIVYRAAYHYMYEVKDNKKAAELLQQAGKHGAPAWVFSLAGRLYADEGSLDLALLVLQEMKESKQDPEVIKRLVKKIESYKKSSNL